MARFTVDIGSTSAASNYNDSSSRYNIVEANAVMAVCRDLLRRGVCKKAIGVLTPYTDQARFSDSRVSNDLMPFLVSLTSSHNKVLVNARDIGYFLAKYEVS